MLPQSEKEPNRAEPVPNPIAVHEQLRRLLTHPLFANSKRYPVLLAHVVEQALLGNASGLKERSIGVEAFGRDPDYDVALDPVVRMAAAEVRKRLSQYYYGAEHAGELVIELPVGSYIPSFRDPAGDQPGPLSATVATPAVETTPQCPVEPANRLEDARRAFTGRSRRHWALIAGLLFVAALVGFGIGRIEFAPKQPSIVARFWRPITGSASTVTYCLGEPAIAEDRSRATPESRRMNGSLDVSDVITMARSIVPLVPSNAAFRIVAASDAVFTQLREGPFVLIGAFDNPWTMRITQDLPFGFEYDHGVRMIVDRKSSPRKSWALQGQIPHTNLVEDYAIVARIHDRVTGQPVMILAGLLGEGTEAASEVVSNPAYLEALLQKAPKNWDGMSLEAVIRTRVVDRHPGPPMVVAIDAW